MNNYEYIVASLPVLQHGTHKTSGPDAGHADALVEEIRSALSSKDLKTVDFLLSAYDGTAQLDKDFYTAAAKSRSRFIREFLDFDRKLRNTKVAWINRALSRPDGQDIVSLGEEDPLDFEERPQVEAALSESDLLARERALDDLMWHKAEAITISDLFDLETILAFIAKLKIIDRWEKLDPQTGSEFFRKLVGEIRATYDNKNIKI